jgi:phosphate transport system substrate-binding protein
VLWATGPAPGQTAASLRGVRRIYVEPFPEKPGAQELRAGLIAALKKSRGITVAASRQDADAVITAKGETWIRGYYSLNPRVRSVTSDTHPIYGGYLSVELKGRESETLWSYLVTPRHPGDDVAHVLGSQMARKLMEALK